MGKLAIERMKSWIQRLPAGEADIPYKYAFNRMWTPNEVLREMIAGSPEGKTFQEEEEKLLEYEKGLKR